MRITAGTDGYPSAYTYEVGQHKKIFPVDFVRKKVPVLHWKTFHPMDDFYGMSPLEAAAWSVDSHNAGMEWNKALLDNSARPSGALELSGDGAMTDEQFKRLQKQIGERYGGSKNAGKPLLLEGGLKWTAMSLSPQEIEFLEGKNTSARDIAMAYGFPPMLLGIPGDNTYSNMQEARLGFWEDTVIPLRDDLTSDLQNWLVPRFGDGLELGFDVDSIPALALRRQRTYERVQAADFLMVNEKREQVGLEPVEGGDVILTSATMVPLGTEPDDTGEPDPPPEDE
jgi:HK97 family phage portal protein